MGSGQKVRVGRKNERVLSALTQGSRRVSAALGPDRPGFEGAPLPMGVRQA